MSLVVISTQKYNSEYVDQNKECIKSNIQNYTHICTYYNRPFWSFSILVVGDAILVIIKDKRTPRLQTIRGIQITVGMVSPDETRKGHDKESQDRLKLVKVSGYSFLYNPVLGASLPTSTRSPSLCYIGFLRLLSNLTLAF